MSNQLELLRQTARQNNIPVMLKQTADLLEETVGKHNPKRILEIGTAIGYSGILMLNAAANSTLNTIEIDENSIQTARQNFKKFGVYDRVNIFAEDAKTLVPQLTGKYDFIFLDGPKGQYDFFLPYLLNLLEINGILFADNVLFMGLVENIPSSRHKHITIAKNLSKFLADLNDNAQLETQLFHIGDGIAISKKLYDKQN